MGELAQFVEESITMRDINSTLQKRSGKEVLEDLVTPCREERDTSSDVPQPDVSKDLDGLNVVNHTKPFDVDHELEMCESLRRRKRKQESINIHRVSSDCIYQPGLCQQDTDIAGAQEHQGMPAGKVEKGASGMGDVEACGSPEVLRRRKRKRETNKLHEVGLDISLRTDGSNSLQALGFDISVSSNVALGIKHASCSILPDNDTERSVGARLAIGVVNNKKEERGVDTCEKLIGSAVVAAGVSNKDICSMSTTKKSGQKDFEKFVCTAPLLSPGSHVQPPGSQVQSDELEASMPSDCKGRGQGSVRLEEVCSEDQAESQKLRMAVAALHSQLRSLYNLAENGSTDCEHCQLIKEELSKLLCNGELLHRKAATHVQELSSEEALVCNSPVGSCTIERAAVETEACETSVLQEGKLESNLPSTRDAHLEKSEEPDRPSGNNVPKDVQEISDAECHLCIELGSLQSEDPDPEELRSGSSEKEVDLLPTERMCNSDRLRTCLEENQDYSGLMLRPGKVHSEVEKHANSSHGVADERKGEEVSVKSSKEDDCWNSAVTRDSCDSYVAGVDNQAEKDGYIDLKCGCTSQKYGDTVGILRLYQNGKLEIQCQCSMGCIKGKPMSPASFERHSGRGASKKWRETIWIVLGDRKVQFSKVKGLDAFVRRYKESGRTMVRQPALPKQSNHRDEFVQCKKCSKRRRFRRKTKEECRLFHDASMNPEWECSNYPFESVSCKDDEEREARQANRGCMRARTCPGCIECVCLGCFTCRFEDCNCRLCTEYVANNK